MPGRQDYTGTEGSLRPRISYVAPFDPTSLITGAGGFWRADMGVTQGGGFATAWADQSSFANNLTVNISPFSQIHVPYSATGFNTSFPGLTFDFASMEGLAVTGVNMASTTMSMFILLHYVGGGSARYSGLANAAGTNDFTNPQIIVSDDTGWRIFSGGLANSLQGNGGSAFALSSGTNYLCGFVADGVNSNMWINGALQGAATAQTATFGTATSIIFLGASGTGLAAGFTAAFFGWTQKAMNSTDWGNLKTWTNSNWGTSF